MGSMQGLGLAFQKTAKLLSKVSPQFDIPPKMHEDSSFSTLLLSGFLIIAILVDVKWYLVKVLICRWWLMTNGAEHLLMSLLAIHISSLLKSTQIFCSFFNRVVFLFLNCKSSLHVLDTSAFSDMWFEYLFSQSVAYLFIFLMVSFDVQTCLILSPVYQFYIL